MKLGFLNYSNLYHVIMIIAVIMVMILWRYPLESTYVQTSVIIDSSPKLT